MKTKILMWLSPLGLLLNLYLFSCATELLRQPSDIAVFLGLLIILGIVSGNYFFIKQFNNKKNK